MKNKKLSIFWFRRDLRLHDNHGLYQALIANENVLPIFIFDSKILNELEDKYDRRVDYIHQALLSIQKQLNAIGSSLLVLQGSPAEVFQQLCNDHSITAVYTNHDYEPYAIERDEAIKNFLATKGISFQTYKDQCIFEKHEVTKDDGKPYTVFTPYSKKWKAKLTAKDHAPFVTSTYFHHFIKTDPYPIPTLEDIGFKKTDLVLSINPQVDKQLLHGYKDQRDFPSVNGTSRMSMHLRFGTVSIRELVSQSINTSETWLNELIWREFYMMILYHFPHVVNGSFKKEYDHVKWLNNEKHFAKWCEGKTGYPIVDAGMRELNATGFMHNRVRMIVSSFLVKDLLIDWKWGEAYFAAKLNDFDLSANNGGWQWAAGSGCDAAPYFRIFNPTEQQKRFDPEFKYIRKWIPEFDSFDYPSPIVDHKTARELTLKVYKETLSSLKTTA
ncbi:MAG: cryptochrome/photolyase family protein [Sphingobacteriaceae bacterium]